MLIPYLSVALPFFVATIAYRNSIGMNFMVLGVPARIVHIVLETLFMFLAGATAFEIVKVKRAVQQSA